MNSIPLLCSIIENVRIRFEEAPAAGVLDDATQLTERSRLRFTPGGPPVLVRYSSGVYLWLMPDGPADPSPADIAEIARLIESRELTPGLAAAAGPEEFREVLLRALPFRSRQPDQSPNAGVIGRTGFLFGGVAANVRARLPFYAGDYLDAFNLKALASIVFMYFACLAPAIAFGGLVATLTGGELGAIEMLVSTAVCGVIYALFSAQPLTILGSTGPVIIFIGLLYDLCRRLELAFLPSLAWVGLWTSLLLVLLAATEASRLIRWFTRFTDEIFAGLISLIFIAEALGDSLRGLRDPATPRESAFLALILALGTYIVASHLAQIRRGPYLKAFYRNLLSDFGPVIAIALMVYAAALMHPVQLDTLALPSTFATTSGRPWLVDLGGIPLWARIAAVLPALLVSVLLFLDQNITVRLVNSRKHRLRKGFGYHLDLYIVGLLVALCSVFGLPWMVAATVRSLNHVQSLANLEKRGGQEVIAGVNENRLTALAIHLLVGCSLLFLERLRVVPMPVLFGLFLYMGISSLRGNQLFDRLRLWLMDPALYPSNHYLNNLPNRVVHRYTAIQAVLLAALWLLKTSALGILFPLLIALLVPLRFYLDRFFPAGDLSHLDAEEEPDQEGGHTLGP